MTFNLSIILDWQNFFHWYILQSWKLKRPPIQLRPHHFWTYTSILTTVTFQEIRIIATGPCIASQLRDVNTICRRSWYIAADIWKIYDFKIEVKFIFRYQYLVEIYSVSTETMINDAFSKILLYQCVT
jgi:hypothetical protein